MSDETLYRQFRLCITTAYLGGRKGVGLCPYPYAEGVTSFACKRNFTVATAAISRCRKATFHIPLAEYFTLTERISLYE